MTTAYTLNWEHPTAKKMVSAIRDEHARVRKSIDTEGRERVSFDSSLMFCTEAGRLSDHEEPTYTDGIPSRKEIARHIDWVVGTDPKAKTFDVEYDAVGRIYELSRADDGWSENTGLYAEVKLATVTIN